VQKGLTLTFVVFSNYAGKTLFITLKMVVLVAAPRGSQICLYLKFIFKCCGTKTLGGKVMDPFEHSTVHFNCL
jgi:hypothetical protein